MSGKIVAEWGQAPPRKPRKKKDPLSMAGALLALVAAVLLRLILLPVGVSSFGVWLVFAAVFVVAGFTEANKFVAPLLGCWTLMAASMVVNPVNILGAAIALAGGTWAFGVSAWFEAGHLPGVKNWYMRGKYQRAVDNFVDGWEILADPKTGLPDSIVVSLGNEGQPQIKPGRLKHGR